MELYAKLLPLLFVACVVPYVCLGRQQSQEGLHASCHLEWSFELVCANVSETLVTQIKAMSGPDGCAHGGEKCLYSLVSYEPAKEVKAKHETPKAHYVDDLTFTFSSPQGSACSVTGYSTSETWYAVLDDGTNYCNMRNLLTGSHLDKAPGFVEKVGECTQYQSANCTKY